MKLLIIIPSHEEGFPKIKELVGSYHFFEHTNRKKLDKRLQERLMSLIKFLVKLIADTFSRFFDKPLKPPTLQEIRLAEEFKSKMLVLGDISLNKDEVTDSWKGYVATIRGIVVDRDPRDFLRWEEYEPLLTGDILTKKMPLRQPSDYYFLGKLH
jgi:hypothetical protein